MQDFFIIYVGSVAAILTISASLIASSKWLMRIWESLYLAKPRGNTVNRSFTYYDVQAGIGYLVDYARGFNPDIIVGINRGGAIVGGILGKHIGKMVHIVEIKRDGDNIDFEKSQEYLSNKKVLVVDDRLSTGHNMSKAYSFVQQYAKDTRCVVFTWVDSPTVQHAPDAFGYKVKSREIPLPWEPGAVKEWK
jgi:hypothetical protein